MWGQNLRDLFLRGGPVMWPLLACSVLAVALILERTVILLWHASRFESLVEWLRRMVQGGQTQEARERLSRSRSPVARVAAAYLTHLSRSPAIREDVVSREASRQVAFMERRLSWLGLLAQVAPLLGLLGTVIGLMTMFHQMELKGAQVQTADLAVGIWQKLLNTAFGMLIAIPCLFAYYWLDGRVGVVTLQIEWITSYLKEWLDASSPASTGTPREPSPNGGHQHAADRLPPFAAPIEKQP